MSEGFLRLAQEQVPGEWITASQAAQKKLPHGLRFRVKKIVQHIMRPVPGNSLGIVNHQIYACIAGADLPRQIDLGRKALSRRRSPATGKRGVISARLSKWRPSVTAYTASPQNLPPRHHLFCPGNERGAQARAERVSHDEQVVVTQGLRLF